MHPLDAGEPGTIGSYRLLGRLGAGGMGRVYLGRSTGGRTVAVKVVHPHFALDEEFRARFRREVEAARRVGGRWTAPVLDADPEAPVPWVATGYVAGPSLTQAVTGSGPLPERSVRALGAGLAEALSAVHALGLVHRDVKPSNVLLALDGPRLIDFGIARATDGTASLTSTGVSIGSPGYMSPEQILGKGVTGAADVFSLGAVLAYAATGAAPFPGDSSAALLYKVVHEEPELSVLHGELREVVAGCLAKAAADRPSPAEVAARLAPGGAAELVTGGWLPGPLVEEVSRTAVRILDLEPARDEPSGPVPFSSPAVGFGPPVPPVPGSGPGSFGAPSSGAPPLPQGPPSGGYGGTGVPPVTPVSPDAPTGTAAGVSLSASASAPAAGPGRRVSCTVTLAVAGALAAVTVGGAFLSGMFRSEDKKDAAQGADSGSRPSPPAGTGAASPAPTDASSPPSVPAAVPSAYVGIWKGPFTVTLLGSEVNGGTFTVTIKNGRSGERIGTVNQYDALGSLSCVDNLVLKGVTEKEGLVAEGSSNGRHSTCTPGAHVVRLKLVAGAVRYTSDEPRAGDPRATLRKEGTAG
ncbi:serine/threonine-protein kinase [Streptomyces sp. NPDC050504]|uniref:serine/threonine-protein kinase n=1 Tax=Streptomyces sp. NPDC050504 TaxID=3365618 RepID=UPI0037A0DC59